MNLKAHYPGFKVWAGAQADIDRVLTIWRECLATSAGPICSARRPAWPTPCMRRSCTRFLTYDVKLDPAVRRLLRDHHGDAAHAGMDRRRQDRARRIGRARRRVLIFARAAPASSSWSSSASSSSSETSSRWLSPARVVPFTSGPNCSPLGEQRRLAAKFGDRRIFGHPLRPRSADIADCTGARFQSRRQHSNSIANPDG